MLMLADNHVLTLLTDGVRHLVLLHRHTRGEAPPGRGQGQAPPLLVVAPLPPGGLLVHGVPAPVHILHDGVVQPSVVQTTWS